MSLLVTNTKSINPASRNLGPAPSSFHFEPKRVLGFDPTIGRGFVYSTDQTQLRRPEYLFLDTPGNPDLQLVCCKIISNHADTNILPKIKDVIERSLGHDDGHHTELKLKFVTRFVCPQKDSDMIALLEKHYLEDTFHARNGILVLIPAMAGTPMEMLWGGFPQAIWRYPTALEFSAVEQSLDLWIESVTTSNPGH